MSNQIKSFYFEGEQVRAVEINSEPWFVGKDVATVLGYSNHNKALKDHVDDEDSRGYRIVTPSGTQMAKVINESGLYSLILSSKLPTAKAFKHWVTSEVLPTIRKHGAYMTSEKIEEILSDPDTIIKLATELKAEREGRLIAEQRVNELTPKARYYDEQMRNPGLMTMTEIAKDFGMSALTLNKILAEKKIQFRQGKHWVITQKYAGKGYAAYEPYAYKKQTSKGMEKGVHNNLKWTQKGRKFIYDLLAEDGIHPIIENMSLLGD